MNGANASTVVATISNRPVRQRKIATGTSHRRCESLRHRPRVRSAIDPNVLPNTINPRWILPRFLSTPHPPSAAPLRASLLWSDPPPVHRFQNAEKLNTLRQRD